MFARTGARQTRMRFWYASNETGMRVLLTLSFSLVAQEEGPPREEGKWPFVPAMDEFKDDAKLDLRYLNEAVAGETGFVRAGESGDFVKGDGTPIRFWAITSDVGREKPWVKRPRGRDTEPDLAFHARFLAKRGVNMVRLHAHINPNVSENPEAALTDVNPKEVDWIWRAVAEYKKAGIYVTISPYWANTMQFNKSWGLDIPEGMPAHALLFFDERLQAAYKEWLRKLLAEPNPYTEIPLAKDPAVGLIQLQNEDSLLFWTVNGLKGKYRADLGKKFYTWVLAKYGSWEKTRETWVNDSVSGDNPAGGTLEFHNIWEMTQTRTGGKAARLADQLEFWVTVMREFNRGMVSYLRDELGCGSMVNATNWKTADTVKLEDAERYVYTSTDVAAVNRYYTGIHNGKFREWAIVDGDLFTSPSILKDPRDFPLNLKQPQGVPMLITESAWVMPMGYATEGPLLVSAFQSLTGIDGFYWFATGDDGWTPPQSANGWNPSQQKWMHGSPDTLGSFPAAALLYRMGYVKKGEPAVVENRAFADLWARRTPVIAETASWDPNRDAGDIAPTSSIKTAVDNLAFLTGPVEVAFGKDPAESKVADFAPLISEDRTQIRSVTGEISMNTFEGWCRVDAPKAQGVAAFFENNSWHELTDTRIWSGNRYGSILVVSMDDLPLTESRKVLVQAGTRSRPTGWQESPSEITLDDGKTVVQGLRVDSYGGAPWQVEKPQVNVKIKNLGLVRATALDMNGNAAGDVWVERHEDGVSIGFPEDVMYVLVEGDAPPPAETTERKR
jgi:hypothetical protein